MKTIIYEKRRSSISNDWNIENQIKVFIVTCMPYNGMALASLHNVSPSNLKGDVDDTHFELIHNYLFEFLAINISPALYGWVHFIIWKDHEKFWSHYLTI